MIFNITAADVRRGDVWLGESEVDVVDVGPGSTLTVPADPFTAGSPQVQVQMVRIFGRIVTGRDRSNTVLSWSLRPDQEIEVRRRTHR